MKSATRDKDALLILTEQSMVEKIIGQVKARRYKGYQVCGIVLLDADWSGKQLDGIEIVANKDTLLSYICRQWVDEILIELPLERTGLTIPINDILGMGVTVHIRLDEHGIASESAVALQLPASYDIRSGKSAKLGDQPVVTIKEHRISHSQPRCKRMLDVIGSIVGCLCTVLLTVVIGPAIFIKSPGPIFFSQTRVGKNGRRFKMYKFRSMYMDAEERKQELLSQNLIKDGRMFKVKHDPRIIGGDHGIGGWIRRYSIDEFPQFWNVLKGDMSLVGTRPPTLDEWEKYEPHHRARLAMKPGITGMWQTSGRSNVTDFEEVVKMDIEYIAKWNLWLDLKILWKTLLVIVKKRGAM